MKRVVSLLLCVVMTFGLMTAGFALESTPSPKITEMYVQLGGTGGVTYNTVIDQTSKKITLALPNTLVGSEALKKAKVTYKAVGDVTSATDSIYQDLTNDVVYTVSDGQTTVNYTLSLELLTLQRDYNFNSASLMEANHGTKERRKASGWVTGTGNGMWYNYGYAFDASGNAIVAETFGSIDLQTETSGMSLLLSKTLVGGELGVASVAAGSDYVSSTDVFTTSIKFNVANDIAVGSDGIVFTTRSSNTEKIAIVKRNDGLRLGYIPNGGTTLTVKEDKVISLNEWHTLDITFTKNTYAVSKYTLDVKLDNEYILTTPGVIYNGSETVEATGMLTCATPGGVYDTYTAGIMLLMDADATGTLKIDDFKLYAQKGDEAAKNDTSSTYTYEYNSETDPGVAGGNLAIPDEPDEPQPPIVPQKPASPAFDGVLDLGFESDGIGWSMHRVNLVTNPGFENTDTETWKAGSTDQNGSMVYSSDKAYSGSKSAYVAYPEGSNSAIQAGVRDYNSYSINPLSEYRMGMAVIYNPVGSSNYKVALSFRTKSSSATTVTNESMNYCVIEDATSDWVYVEDYFLSTNSNETNVEMFMPRINGGSVGTYAYFDDVYFGTVSHIVKKDQAGFEDDSYSGDYLLHLGAYNGLHGKDEVTSLALDAREFRTYTMTAYTAARNGNAKAKIGIAFYDTDGKELSVQYSESLAPSDWTQQTVTASAPEGTAKMKLILAAEGSGSVMFDHVDYQMEEQTVESIKATDDISLLLGLNESINYTLPCYAADIYDMPVENFDETYVIVGQSVDGISLSGNILSVSSAVSNGTAVTVKVSANSLNDEFTVTVVRGFVEITGASVLTRTSSDVTSSYSAYFNSNGSSNLLANGDVTWQISPASVGVTIENGVLTIKPEASIGEYVIKAIYKDNTNIFAQYKITVQKQADSSADIGGGFTPGGSNSVGGSAASSPSVPVTVPSQVQTIPEFDDVDYEHWAYDAITYFASKGYVSGDGSGEFKVDNNITRAEFIKILLMIMGVEVSDKDIPFTDVPYDAWYRGYVATAYSLGIVNGVTDTTFAPESFISRQDMAVIIHRAASMMGVTFETGVPKDFDDKSAISDYAEIAVEALSSNSIINGMADNTFMPHANATRAESVQMLYNLIMR